MRSVMICAVFFCSLVVSQSLQAEDLPIPATVHLVDGNPQANVFVIEYGLKDVTWSRDDRGQAVTSKPTSEVERVELGKLPEVNVITSAALLPLTVVTGKTRLTAWLRPPRNRVMLTCASMHISSAPRPCLNSSVMTTPWLISTIKTSFSNWVFVVDAMILEAEVQPPPAIPIRLSRPIRPCAIKPKNLAENSLPRQSPKVHLVRLACCWLPMMPRPQCPCCAALLSPCRWPPRLSNTVSSP